MLQIDLERLPSYQKGLEKGMEKGNGKRPKKRFARGVGSAGGGGYAS